VAVAATPAAGQQSRSDTPAKPNVVLVVMDNLGWGEIGCYGGCQLRGATTPNLDRFASQGMRLLNFFPR